MGALNFDDIDVTTGAPEGASRAGSSSNSGSHTPLDSEDGRSELLHAAAEGVMA